MSNTEFMIKKNTKISNGVKLFKDKKVIVMGLGLLGGGVGVAKFFVKQGAKVLVTDLKTKNQLRESIQKLKGLPIKYVLGRHRNKDFIDADLIIKNPAVPKNSPYLKIAEKHNIPVRTDIDIFFDLCPVPIIGITGTKGKSTVATLIYLFLKKKYPKTILAGNIGLSPLEILPKINKKTKVILELSSFELEDLRKSPKIAVVTTLFPDHLNRYKNFKDYVNAKKSIFKYQKKDDILILNYDNPETRKLASEALARVRFFRDSNVSAALAVAKLFKIPKKDIKKILSNFKGIPNRQELIATKNGIKYFNDTTATTPQSVILAIKTFKKRFPKSKIILIAGGLDKNLNYKELAKNIRGKINYLVLLPGTASDKLKKELKGFSMFPAKSMRGAVKKAANIAKKGDIVLLSPGAASFTPHFQKRKKGGTLSIQKESGGFNLFKNEFDRGEQFKKYVKEISSF